MGRELDAITLHTPETLDCSGITAALTENFLPVEIEGRTPANLLVRVRVTALNSKGTIEATPEGLDPAKHAAKRGQFRIEGPEERPQVR